MSRIICVWFVNGMPTNLIQTFGDNIQLNDEIGERLKAGEPLWRATGTEPQDTKAEWASIRR